jgi:hypothetical protein
MNYWGLMMDHDFITEEIRDIRHRLAAQFGNDVSRIGEDLRRRQAMGGRRIVKLPKRTPQRMERTLTLDES